MPLNIVLYAFEPSSEQKEAKNTFMKPSLIEATPEQVSLRFSKLSAPFVNL